MKEPDWHLIFDEDIIEVRTNEGGYANKVWEVETTKGHYIVKVVQNPLKPDKPFWDGLLMLFGLNVHWDMEYRRALSNFINQNSPLRIPEVIKVDTSGEIIPQPYVVLETLPGEPASLEEGNTARLAAQLGDHFGRLHRATFDYWGSFPGAPRFEPATWPVRVAETMERMAEKWFKNNPKVQKRLDNYLAQARTLPVPDNFVLVFPDFKASQFLEENGHLSALIDIESQVIGPRELDFIALEYGLQNKDVRAFVESYEKHLPVPDLEQVRPVYRFLYYLIQTLLPDADLDEWMDSPVRFKSNAYGRK